jgi:hypothetical protein
MRKLTLHVCLLASAVLVACGGGSSTPTSPSTPSTPSTPSAPANRAPVIDSLNFGPSFGIAGLTQFTFTASASDPDGDALTYSWDVAGNAFSGTNGTIVFSGGGNGTARLTVTDSKGMASSDSRTFTVGSMTGRWSGSIPGYTNLSFDLTQNGAIVTGTFFEQFFGSGRIDPAQTGRIDADGNVEMRFKLSVFTDFEFKGRMDSTGRRITGGVFGSGFSGQPFTMTKQ